MIEERDSNFKLLTHKNRTLLKITKSEKGLFGEVCAVVVLRDPLGMMPW